MILPGQRVGILGSGQLGRMLAYEARRLGYGVDVYSPEAGSPTEAVSDRAFVADYLDFEQLDAFIDSVDVVTYEFENVPAATAERCADRLPTHPSSRILEIAQDRLREKSELRSAGFPVTEYREIHSAKELGAGLAALGASVLKTARSGYDGKGQLMLRGDEASEEAWSRLGTDRAILERRVDFAAELSVVVARTQDGSCVAFDTFENRHANHILDLTVCPARFPPTTLELTQAIATGVAETLGLVGVLCVEMFVLPDGDVLVNELAPRPHNSGHLTIEAAGASQFEQQLRAVCNLPLGDSSMRVSAAAMANLLGDLWFAGDREFAVLPRFDRALRVPNAHLHLYGKREPRIGRKMGHLTITGTVADDVLDEAMRIRSELIP